MADEYVEHPMSGAKEHHFDVDLGDGHTLSWSEYRGARCGGIIKHTAPTESGMCSGAFWLRGNRFNAENPESKRAEWDMTGTFACPTLSPSFLCHCGDHGFVRDGRWVRA